MNSLNLPVYLWICTWSEVTRCRPANTPKFVSGSKSQWMWQGPKGRIQRLEWLKVEAKVGVGFFGCGVLGRGARSSSPPAKAGSLILYCFGHCKRSVLNKKCKIGSHAGCESARVSHRFCTRMQVSAALHGDLAGLKVTQRSNKKCTYKCVVSTAHWHRWSQSQAPVSLCVGHYAEILIDMRQKV